MKLKLQKRLSAEVLKCSPKRIVFDTEKLADIKKAIRKADIRNIISLGYIWKVPVKGVSRVRARHIARQYAKGRRRGAGSRKGKRTARLAGKDVWINRIRSQREILKHLRANKKLSSRAYRMIYAMAKGGFFRSRRHLMLYMREHNLIK